MGVARPFGTGGPQSLAAGVVKVRGERPEPPGQVGPHTKPYGDPRGVEIPECGRLGVAAGGRLRGGEPSRA